MNKKTLLQVVLLMVLAGIVFYMVCPKYYFFTLPDDKAKNETNFFRCNKITGKVEITSYFEVKGWRKFQ